MQCLYILRCFIICIYIYIYIYSKLFFNVFFQTQGEVRALYADLDRRRSDSEESLLDHPSLELQQNLPMHHRQRVQPEQNAIAHAVVPALHYSTTLNTSPRTAITDIQLDKTVNIDPSGVADVFQSVVADKSVKKASGIIRWFFKRGGDQSTFAFKMDSGDQNSDNSMQVPPATVVVVQENASAVNTTVNSNNCALQPYSGRQYPFHPPPLEVVQDIVSPDDDNNSRDASPLNVALTPPALVQHYTRLTYAEDCTSPK